MTDTITIGVDPGVTGAIAMLDSNSMLIDCYDMPVLDGLVSAHQLNELEAWNGTQFGTVIIEDVHAMPKQGVTSSFNFGRSKGVVEGVFATCGRPIVYVSPARWKRALGLSTDKSASRRRAIELWPDRTAMFGRVKDNGRAEAALIAYWWLHHGNGAR